jgi:hypothetical protein
MLLCDGLVFIERRNSDTAIGAAVNKSFRGVGDCNTFRRIHGLRRRYE